MKSISIILLALFTCLSYGQGNGLYKFKTKENREGFMDVSGKIKIKPVFLRVGDFHEGLAKASVDRTSVGFKWIFIDLNGDKAIDIDESIPQTDFCSGFARLSFNGEHWFINTKGVNEFGKTWKDGVGHFENGIAFVSDSIRKDFYKIDLKGNKIDDQIFSVEEIKAFRKENSVVKTKKNLYASDSYIAFEQEKLWGFKNGQDSIVIAPQFYKVDRFENGICAVKLKKARFSSQNDYFMDAIIDEQGNIITKVDMHTYQGFQGELIEFYGAQHYGGGVFYLDKKGQPVVPFE